MTAALAVAAALVALAAAVKAVPVLWQVTVSTGKALWRAVRWSGRVVWQFAQGVDAIVRLPAHVATIAGQLIDIRSLAQEARDEWHGATHVMVTTVQDHDRRLDDHDSRIGRLEQLAHGHE